MFIKEKLQVLSHAALCLFIKYNFYSYQVTKRQRVPNIE